MKKVAVLLSIVFLSASAFAQCPFAGLYINELKTDPRFSVTAEQKTTISRGLFWANEDFFRPFNKKGCRGAYRTADVTELASGNTYTYFRTVLDECDGGNTVGVIVNKGRHKAMAEIGDSEITCLP